jgi:gamma-glutamylaminecyclotransferase
MYVFVYGTLKKDEPNYHWLTNEEHGHAKFVCKGSTSELYPLIIASKYNIPFLLDKPRTGKVSRGSVGITLPVNFRVLRIDT